MKKRSYKHIHGHSYFWRTYGQKEIDLIEEREGNIYPFEFKWSTKNQIITPKEWVSAYPQAKELSIITPDNYLDFVA